jgi:hypothetical protein
MDKLEELKLYFNFKNTGVPDINHYGNFRLGLTDKEISNYLFVRANGKVKIPDLKKAFYKVAGVNTCALIETTCSSCKKKSNITLMYRHDVERFADVMFLNKPTYWD